MFWFGAFKFVYSEGSLSSGLNKGSRKAREHHQPHGKCEEYSWAIYLSYYKENKKPAKTDRIADK
jgi:hypothetical protein